MGTWVLINAGWYKRRQPQEYLLRDDHGGVRPAADAVPPVSGGKIAGAVGWRRFG